MSSPPPPAEHPTSPVTRLMRSLSGKHMPSLAKPAHQDPLPVPEEVPEATSATPEEDTAEVEVDTTAIVEPAPIAEPAVEAVAVPTSPILRATSPTPKLHAFDRIKAKFGKKITVVDPVEAAAPVENPTEVEGENADVPAANDDNDDDDDDDPPTLAERIRALIDSLPSPTPRSSRMIPKMPKMPAMDSEVDADGRPVPPPAAIPIKDRRLIRKLYNPIVMNSERRDSQSIWSILSSVRQDGSPADSGNDTDSTHSGASHAFTESSFMMYSPLIPTKGDLVEVADSEIIPGPSTTSLQLPMEAPSAHLSNQAFKWPWSKKQPVPECTPEDGDADSTVPPVVHRKWIPSTTKLSCEVTWWGYRLYLPPPVLAILSDKTIEATKRAALITTALTWMFSNLPISSFPLPMQPALLLFQKLVPYLSYIGTFISWSWGTVKGYDVGYGVTLSATWLLPVALLPSTWEAGDWPGAPLPGTTPATDPPATTTPTAPTTGTPAASTPTPTPAAPTTEAPVDTTPVVSAPTAPTTDTPVVPTASTITPAATEDVPSPTSSTVATVGSSTSSSKIADTSSQLSSTATPSKIDKAVEAIPVESEPVSEASPPKSGKRSSVGGLWKYMGY